MGPRRTTVLVLVAAAATVGIYGSAFALSTTDDRPDHLDVDPVSSTASAACASLRADLDALPPLAPGAPPAERLDRLAVQDRAVRALVTTVRGVGQEALDADAPAEDWLADWERLAAARRAYAEAGAQGPFSQPVVDGRPLSDRMSGVGLDACRVPASLTAAP